jgi:tRNA threonylcarbamoyladenosine biosynthesis protein TsaB
MVEDDRLLAEASLDHRLGKRDQLLQLARTILLNFGLGVDDLSRIAFSEGPGSFTGLRVGMAAALGLAAGGGIGVVAVGSLEVLAYPWRLLEETIVVARGLRRSLVHLAAFTWDGLRFHERVSPCSSPIEEVADRITTGCPGRLIFTGDAVDSLADAISERFGDRARWVTGDPARAAHVAFLATDPLRPTWTGTELEGKTPRYLRDADARKPEDRTESERGHR